jgi:triosephosphate isomerase
MFFGNWKMNHLQADAEAFAEKFAELFTPRADGVTDVGFAPPVTSLPALTKHLSAVSGITLGVQNVHWLPNGAHTGELSTDMVKDAGAEFAIVGHSERRQYYAESDETVSQRAKAAIEAGLTAIVCIGETKEQFEKKITQDVIKSQIEGSLAGIDAQDMQSVIVAYEPVWAIGTGLTATPEIAQDVHAFIRSELSNKYGEAIARQTVILYGGSAKPDNIAELMACPDVDGGLVGGASLKPDSFWELVNNGRQNG